MALLAFSFESEYGDEISFFNCSLTIFVCDSIQMMSFKPIILRTRVVDHVLVVALVAGLTS